MVSTADLPLATTLDEVLGNLSGQARRMLLADLVNLVVSEANVAISAGVVPYATTADGLAATSNGGYFAVVPGAADPTVAMILYRKVSGNAVEQSRISSAQALAALSTSIAAKADKTYVDGADTSLSGRINTEKGRLDTLEPAFGAVQTKVAGLPTGAQLEAEFEERDVAIADKDYRVVTLDEFNYPDTGDYYELKKGHSVTVSADNKVLEDLDENGLEQLDGEWVHDVIRRKEDGFRLIEYPDDWRYPDPAPAGIKSAVTDAKGAIVRWWDGTDQEHPGSGAQSTEYFSDAEAFDHDNEQRSWSLAIETRPVPANFVEVVFGAVNLILGRGQSNGAGAQTVGPRGDLPQVANFKTMGLSVRCKDANNCDYEPAGGAHVVASIAGTTMTVEEVRRGLVQPGAVLVAFELEGDCEIVEQLTGPEFGAGTYLVSSAQDVPSGTHIMLRGTPDERFLDAVATTRFAEAEDWVANGNIGVGDPPMSPDADSPYYEGIVPFARSNLSAEPVYYLGLFLKLALNRRAGRSDTAEGSELVVVENASVGATGLRQHCAYAPFNIATNYIRGDAVDWPPHPYGAAVVTGASAVGIEPPTTGMSAGPWTIETNCYRKAKAAVVKVKARAEEEWGPGFRVQLVIDDFTQGTGDSGRGTAAAYLANLQKLAASTDEFEALCGQTESALRILHNERPNRSGHTPDSVGWGGNTTFAAGAVVDYGAFHWLSTADGNQGHEPGVAEDLPPGTEPWWVRLRQRGPHRNEVFYAKYDAVTEADLGYYSKVSDNNQPVLVAGVLNATYWAPLAGTWSPAGVEVDNAKRQMVLTDNRYRSCGPSYAWSFNKRVHGDHGYPKHAGLKKNQLASKILIERKDRYPADIREILQRDRQLLIKIHTPDGGHLDIGRFFHDFNEVWLPTMGVRFFDDAAPLEANGVPNGTIIPYLPSRGIQLADYELEIYGTNTLRMTMLSRPFASLATVSVADPAGSFGGCNFCVAPGAATRFRYPYVVGPSTNPVQAQIANQNFDMRDFLSPGTFVARAA